MHIGAVLVGIFVLVVIIVNVVVGGVNHGMMEIMGGGRVRRGNSDTSG